MTGYTSNMCDVNVWVSLSCSQTLLLLFEQYHYSFLSLRAVEHWTFSDEMMFPPS